VERRGCEERAGNRQTIFGSAPIILAFERLPSLQLPQKQLAQSPGKKMRNLFSSVKD
jgi:hypothetical protein